MQNKKKPNKVSPNSWHLPSSMSVITIHHADSSAKPTAYNIKSEEGSEESGSEWAEWGNDNLWPTRIRRQNEESTTSYPLMFKQIAMLLGSGVEFYREKIVDGEIVKEYFEDEAIQSFIDNNGWDRIGLERGMDYKFFGNTFCELIFSKDTSKITNTYHQEAEFCRLAVQDSKTKKIPIVGICTDWGNPTEVAKVTFLNKRDYSPDKIQETIKGQKEKKCIMQSTFPAPGRSYYAVPPHIGIHRKDGWLKYANSIPGLLNRMISNNVTLKYHIEIPDDYFAKTISNWKNLPEAEQEKTIRDRITELDNFLSTQENAYGSFVSFFGIDKTTKKEIPGWRLTPITDKIKKDDFIPVAQEADQQIVRALGIDPSIAGLQPQGGKMGAGSGSDKRVAYNSALFMSETEINIILEPLYLVKKYNKWPSDVKFGFKHNYHTTLDDEPTGVQKPS